MNALYTKAIPVNLTKLVMNKLFVKRSKKRTSAISRMAKTINVIGLKELSLSGCKLKADLSGLIIKLLDNRTLEVMDISGNQAGDSLAVALTKFLQNNRTLHTLFWDENELSITGLKSITIGIQRNVSLRHFPLPLLDITALLKRENAETDLVNRITKDIQRIVYEKSLNQKLDYEGDYTVGKLDISAISKHNTFNSVTPKTPISERRRSSKPQSSKKKPKPFVSVDISRASQLWGAPEEISSEGTDSNHEAESAFQLSRDISSENLMMTPREDEESEEKKKDSLFDDERYRRIPESYDSDNERGGSYDTGTLPLTAERSETLHRVKRTSSSQRQLGKRKKKKTQRSRTPLGSGGTAIGLQRQPKNNNTQSSKSEPTSVVQSSNESFPETEEIVLLHPIAEVHISSEIPLPAPTDSQTEIIIQD
jgi:hypothetical protein